jgi:GR25 family glycosyltransferase involved in LPS biosynthesis
MPNIPVIIIGAVDSKRLDYFQNQTDLSTYFEPYYQEAIMLLPKDVSSFIDEETSNHHELLYGRQLLSAEIGCAATHRLAQIHASKTEIGALILEDDARFNDLDTLKKLVETFLNAKKGQNAILSLFDGRDWSKLNTQFRESNPILRNIGPTSFAVAYAITPSAGRTLAEANSSHKYLADWPSSNCSFYTSSLTLISHGDASTISLIDPLGKRSIRPPLLVRLQVISSIYFFLNIKRFGSLRTFLKEMWLPRVQYYISTAIFRFLMIRNSEK